MERKRSKLEASWQYSNRFGTLPQESAIVSVEAYTAGGRAVDIARAWLLEDQRTVDMLTWKETYGAKEAERALHTALFMVARELWASEHMPKTHRPKTHEPPQQITRTPARPRYS